MSASKLPIGDGGQWAIPGEEINGRVSFIPSTDTKRQEYYKPGYVYGMQPNTDPVWAKFGYFSFDTKEAWLIVRLRIKNALKKLRNKIFKNNATMDKIDLYERMLVYVTARIQYGPSGGGDIPDILIEEAISRLNMQGKKYTGTSFDFGKESFQEFAIGTQPYKKPPKAPPTPGSFTVYKKDGSVDSTIQTGARGDVMWGAGAAAVGFGM